MIIMMLIYNLTLLAIMPIKDLTSNCVGQLSWQGASAQRKHLLASNNAPININ